MNCNLLHKHFDVFLKVISVQIENQIMHHIVAVTHYYQWQLIGKFCLLQIIFHSFSLIAVRLPTDSLHLFDLTRPRGCLQKNSIIPTFIRL